MQPWTVAASRPGSRGARRHVCKASAVPEAAGRTDDGRRLHIAFTLGAEGRLIRVISARDMPYQSLIKAWLAEKPDRASSLAAAYQPDPAGGSIQAAWFSGPCPAPSPGAPAIAART